MASKSRLGPELQHGALRLLQDILCVTKGESVLITTDANADHDVEKALQIGAHLLGAKPLLVTMDPPLPLQGLLADDFIPEPLLAAVQKTDLWFDLAMPYLAGSKAFDAVMQNRRTRYFLGSGIKAESLIRMYTRVDLGPLIAAAQEFQAVLEAAAGKEIRVTSPKGTDVVFTPLKIPKTDSFQIARATKPGGFFDPLIAGWVPVAESVKGTIVIEAVTHDYYTLLSEPIALEMNGNIQSVRGGATELRAVDRALRRAANGGYGGIVHFSCGLNPAARFTGACFLEDSRVMGSNAIGFGLSPGQPGGGENHPDGIVQHQSMWIEGKQVVKDGDVCAPASVANAIAKLQPRYG